MTREPNSLFPGGQEKTVVPAHTVCVYVLPDGDWNESANEVKDVLGIQGYPETGRMQQSNTSKILYQSP